MNMYIDMCINIYIYIYIYIYIINKYILDFIYLMLW